MFVCEESIIEVHGEEIFAVLVLLTAECSLNWRRF